MKITITEFRDMVAAAVRRTVAEARKPKEIASRSEESIQAQRDAQLRGLPGYAHGEVLDMSKPLGKRNRTKKQGASNMGNWTSESRLREADGIEDMPAVAPDSRAKGMLLQTLQRHGIPFDKAQKIADELYANDAAQGYDAKTEGLRRLVRMVVREQIRAKR